MRLIGTVSNELDARKLANYLSANGIGNSVDASFEAATGHISYQIWIHEEDRMSDAAKIFEEFQKNPSDSKYNASEPEPPLEPQSEEEAIEMMEPKRFHNYFTNFIIALCAVLFFLNAVQEVPLRKEKETMLLTPIQALLMYDLPPDFQKGPYWKGFYTWVVNKITKEDPSQGEGPLFIRIRQGEVWRLISPCILHRDLLHILFNMLWVWYLGRPIEQRIGPLRTILLSLIAGIGSNTLQYFMSGPFFIGYSGIVTALASFIWMRERIAPWEGYPLNRATILFLLFFIIAIFGLQVVSFLLQIFANYQLAPNIANTAHIAGAIIGAILGRLSFFAQRVPK